MANKNSYSLSIYLYDEGGDSTGKAPVTIKNGMGGGGKEPPGGDSGGKTPKITAAQVVLPIAKAAMQARVDTLNILSGSEQQSKRLELQKSIASSALDLGANVLSGVVSGAAIGTALGLATGGPIGAAVGVAITLLEKVTSIAIKQNQLNAQNTVESYGNAQARQRLGVSYNMSRGIK